jgi:hypothetical protein
MKPVPLDVRWDDVNQRTTLLIERLDASMLRLQALSDRLMAKVADEEKEAQ